MRHSSVPPKIDYSAKPNVSRTATRHASCPRMAAVCAFGAAIARAPTQSIPCEARAVPPKSATMECPVLSVRPFCPEEWATYRDLRLRALTDAPQAFGSTSERESALPEQYWADRVATATDSALQFLLLAELQAEPVGLALGFIDPAEPELAHLYQMWVAPHARSHGCGTGLLQAVSTWARGTTARALTLCVTCGNSSARRLYERAGFTPYRTQEPLRPGSTELVQPMILTL